MTTLDLAVVTYGPEGISRVASMVLPPTEGVRYVVSWQHSEGLNLPPELERADVTIVRPEGRGISRNRNCALEHCSADVILFADDDIHLRPAAIERLRLLMEENPDVDVMTLRSEHGDMSRFPDVAVKLGIPLPKGYYCTSFEIALRRATAGGLRCREELGIGSEQLHGGEDEIFLYDAIKSGLDCRFYPLTICAHPHASTGLKEKLTAGNLAASGYVIRCYWGWQTLPRIILKAWRSKRSGRAGFWSAVRNMLHGAWVVKR